MRRPPLVESVAPLRADVLLKAIGGIATVAGARGVVVGAAEVPGRPSVSANVDSEYRFYAAWYLIFGLLLLRATRREPFDRALAHACAGGFAAAAAGRVVSAFRLGAPSRRQQTLLAVEVFIVSWLTAALRRRVTLV